MEAPKNIEENGIGRSSPEEKILRPQLTDEQRNIRKLVNTYNKWLVVANDHKTAEDVIAERALFMDLRYYLGVVIDYLLTSKKIRKDRKEKFVKYKDILNKINTRKIKIEKKIWVVEKVYSKIYNTITTQGLLGLQEYGTYKSILETYKGLLVGRVSVKKIENSPKQEIIRILNFRKRSENVKKMTETIDRILRRVEDDIMNWGSIHLVSVLFYTIMADSFVSKFDTEYSIKKRIEKCDEIIETLEGTDNPDEKILNAILVFYDYITQAYTRLTTTYSVNIIS